MPNGQANPLAAPLTAFKQMGEQTAAAIQSIGTGMTQAASQGLDTLISGVPGMPGMPGVPAAGKGIPSPQQLMPANLQQALGQIENVLIPPGLPRPSQALAKQPAPQPQPQPQPTPPTNASAQPSGATPVRRRVMERRGL